MKHKYVVDPRKIYTEELSQLLRCFSDIQRVGKIASDIQRVNWRQVEHLRHFNFILMEAIQTGEALIKIPP